MTIFCVSNFTKKKSDKLFLMKQFKKFKIEFQCITELPCH